MLSAWGNRGCVVYVCECAGKVVRNGNLFKTRTSALTRIQSVSHTCECHIELMKWKSNPGAEKMSLKVFSKCVLAAIIILVQFGLLCCVLFRCWIELHWGFCQLFDYFLLSTFKRILFGMENSRKIVDYCKLSFFWIS